MGTKYTKGHLPLSLGQRKRKDKFRHNSRDSLATVLTLFFCDGRNAVFTAFTWKRGNVARILAAITLGTMYRKIFNFQPNWRINYYLQNFHRYLLFVSFWYRDYKVNIKFYDTTLQQLCYFLIFS